MCITQWVTSYSRRHGKSVSGAASGRRGQLGAVEADLAPEARAQASRCNSTGSRHVVRSRTCSCGGSAHLSVSQLCLNLQWVWSCSHGHRFERETLKDCVSVAGPLVVTKFLILSQTETKIYFKLKGVPGGPTMTFPVNRYMLVRAVGSSLHGRYTHSFWCPTASVPRACT